jgi:hypothetical protein
MCLSRGLRYTKYLKFCCLPRSDGEVGGGVSGACIVSEGSVVVD